MKSRNLKTRITGAILTFSLLLGIGIASSVTAQAQYPNDQYGRRDRNYEREQKRREREQRRLEREQRRNQRRSGSYGNNGNYGYGNNGYGNQDNYANYGGSHQLRQTALNAGYNNGMEEGRNDRARNERFDYNDEADFQRATQDYNSRLGDRETFRRYFRDAFARGYRDGYGNNTGYGYQRY
jgi:hypothetical protein